MIGELTLEGVVSGYGPVLVVQGVTLRVPPGGALVVLGRNGAGKTTLINTIAGRVRLQAGSIRLGGREIGAASASVRCRAGVGLVPQDRQVFRTLSVEENLRVADLRRGATVASIYHLFPRLRERRHLLAGQLSGGEQQMLAIARALMGGPRCLLLDEPFEGLAPVIVDGLIEVLRRLRAETGVAIILVEQHARLALDLADQGLVLEQGRVRLAGPKAELLDRWHEVEDMLAVAG
ncbi:MAG: ABC transporter ATP-binding protein [Acetobacteraceae bacterium]